MQIQQATFDEIGGDKSTNSNAFVELLKRNLDTGAGMLILHATFSLGGSGYSSFRFTVDGVPTRCARTRVGSTVVDGSNATSGALTVMVPVAAGAHTVALQWCTQSSGLIRAQTKPNYEHCSMVILEVS
jgi:hypothetical protein